MRITLSTGTAAELALPPEGTTIGRGLVLWPDIFGLRPLFDGHAQRLADQHGWAVAAVEVFPGREDLPLEARFGVVPELDDAAKLADAEAAAAVLEERGAGPVGLLGFCMGGMYVMKCLASSAFDRGAAFYGMIRMPENWRSDGQHDAIDTVRSRPQDLLGIFGTEDPWCPLDQIDELEATGAHVVRYDGADHGWAQDPTRDNYSVADATDAWGRAERFLATGAL